MKIKRKTFVRGLLATLCACTALTFGAVFSPNAEVNANAAATVKASILNLDSSGAEQTYFKDSLNGKQSENIYFGINNGAAVKWRVLSTGAGNKYGSGMLLWADKQITTEGYNTTNNNPDFAFWGTSQIRASLNGGTYYNVVSDITSIPSATTDIGENASWYGKLFKTADERASVVKTGSYTTDNWGLDTSSSQWSLKKAGITVTTTENDTSDTVYGKYNTNRINSSHPTSQYATFNETAGTVQESTSDDYLFLLDYYDVNNGDFGFENYAAMVAEYANGQKPAIYTSATWDNGSDYYPTKYDGETRDGGSDYTQANPNGITCATLGSEGYLLRNIGREGQAGSFVMRVQSNYIEYGGGATARGIRPAFNFKADTVVYATAADLSSVGATFASVDTPKSYTDGKPTYKLYIKAEDYVNYNGGGADAPKMTTDGSTVTIEKSGQTGKAVILLADKKGEVKYQAATSFANGKATVSLPTGVKASDYAVTTLFMGSDNGTEKSDIVKASYTAKALTLTAPSNITTTKAYDGTAKALAYNDTQHTLKYLAPDWYLDDVYSDTDVMEVTYEHIARGDKTSTFAKPQISGGSVDDGINTALKADPATAANLKNAGKYKVTLKLLSDSIRWSNDNLVYDTATDAQKELQRYRVVEYEIKPKEVNVTYSIYDTSGTTPAEKVGATSVTYTTDTTKTYKVDIKTVVTTESIPTGTTNRFPKYEIVYSGTANDEDEDEYDEVSTVPTLAGSYTAKFKDENAETSNYELKCAQTSFAYTVDKAEVTLPTFNVDKHTYNANEQDFALTGTSYDTAIVKIDNIKAGSVALTANEAGTEYKSADEYFVVKYDATNKKFTATNAAAYKVTFALVDSNNYTWATALATTEKAKTFTVEKKELVIKFKSPLTNNSNFNLKTSTTGNVTAEYDTNGGGETPSGGSLEEPVLLLYYVFSNGTTTGQKVLVGTSSGNTIGNFTLDVTALKGVNNKFTAGTYSLEFELAPEAANAVNKNYKLGTSAAQALTVTAGEASLDDIGILYTTVKKEADGEPAAAIPEDGLKYEYDDKLKQATEYKFELDFSNIDYLTYAGTDSISLKYAGDSTATQAINAGKLTVTVKIKVKDDEAANHSLPAAFDVTQTNTFKSYTNNGDGTATLTFEVEIKKHEITVSGSDIPLKYQREGGQVEDYDPKNPPEYNGKPVTISLPHESAYPHGIKEITFDEATPKKTAAGKYTIEATVTLDDNHCVAGGGSTVKVEIPWEITKEVIRLVWSKPAYFDEYLNDSSVAHLQVMLLSGLTEEKEKAIKYSFYRTVDGAPDTTPLSEAELKALCTNDRFTDPNETWLYVKAELTEEGAKKYVLEDDATKNPKRFKLGGQMTLIELKVDGDKLKGYEYGGALDLSKVFTLINTETGDPWDSSYYEIRVLKDGVDIGEISEFNPADNDAGKYVIQVNIKPEYADSYTLDKSNVVDFVINRKQIALPTVGNILFSGEYVNLADYLGGSYAEYKDIIALSGDYKDLRNVSKSGYKARLTLTDPNYTWATPTTAEPASLKLFAVKLYDNAVELLDDVTAELQWNITPLVVDVSEMWTKGKDGATLNLPENIKNLITGETLSVLYRYYDDADLYLETPELKGGKSFRVEAVFGGIDADSGNVLFKTSDGNFGTVSDKISYTVPQSAAAAFFGSAVSFLKANWLWLVIAAVALILLILIIVLAAKSAKKKRIREEQRRLEEKEERERKEEERKREQEERRREDREERMARMQQQQMMMPQMMPQMMQQQMPQQMPQSAPQAQPAAAGGGSVTEAQFMQMQAEIATLKAEATLRAEAALRAEQQIAQTKTDLQLASILARLGGEQTVAGGVSLEKLTELIRTEVNNAFESREKAKTAAAPEAAPAATQVPPDAVMTTVTTTKIDTTKKPAQNAQAAAPVRTVVRNVVAPMPVDDGRVFDVGGFYKPADPITDGIDNLLGDEPEKKD